MKKLEKLKQMIDEEGYPYFEDAYLSTRLEDTPIRDLARELSLIKSGIEGIKIGDIDIPSPKNHFLMLASQYRTSQTGTVGRADER